MADFTCTFSDPVLADGSPASSNSDLWSFKSQECDYSGYIQDFFNSTSSGTLDISGSTVTASLSDSNLLAISDYLKYDFTFRVILMLVLGFFTAVWFYRRN